MVVYFLKIPRAEQHYRGTYVDLSTSCAPRGLQVACHKVFQSIEAGETGEWSGCQPRILPFWQNDRWFIDLRMRLTNPCQ